MGEERDPLLEEYRERKTFPDEARARLWQRIETSIRAGKTGPRIAQDPRRTHRRAWVAAAIACAAAVIALLCIERQIFHRAEEPPVHEAAQVSETQKQSRAHEGERMRRARIQQTVPADREVSEPEPEPEPPKVRAPKRPPVGSSMLAAELAVLKGAERALDENEPNKALALLNRHEVTYGDGQLREDRMALRIQALCALGKTAQGRGEATLFEREFPTSNHLKKVRNACKEDRK